MGQLKVWSTEGLASDKALSFWNEAVCSAFLDVRTERGKNDYGFHAHLQSSDVGPLLVNRLQAQPYSVSGGNGGGEWVLSICITRAEADCASTVGSTLSRPEMSV